MKRILAISLMTAVLLFSCSVHAVDQVVIIPMGGKKPTGDAVAADVLEGKTFSNADDVNISGTMVNNGATTINPAAADRLFPKVTTVVQAL